MKMKKKMMPTPRKMAKNAENRASLEASFALFMSSSSYRELVWNKKINFCLDQQLIPVDNWDKLFADWYAHN